MEILDDQILLLRPSDISFETSIYCVYKIGIIILLKTTPSPIFQRGGGGREDCGIVKRRIFGKWLLGGGGSLQFH